MSSDKILKLDEIVVAGKIVNVHGVKGYMVVLSFMEPADNILNYADWFWDYQSAEEGKNLWHLVPKLRTAKFGKKIVLQIADCADRDLARSYVGVKIGVKRQDLPKLAADEYYWSDLIGLEVLNQQGDKLGVVDHLFATGANDVIVVKDANTGREHLIPYVKPQVIREIDLQAHKMRVDWDSEF